MLDQLTPRARPYYELLRTADRTEDVPGWLVEAARKAGWDGELE